MKKISPKIGYIATLMVCYILMFSVTGCNKITEIKPKLYNGKITIGTVSWPGYLALYVARDKGYFKEAGLDVDIKRYTSQTECSRDYINGRLQGRANLTNEAINEALQGLKHKAVLVIDNSNGSDGIISSSGITSLLEAKGKKIAFEHGTLEEYFLIYALEQNQMSLKDIIPVNLDPEASAKALIEGKVDVAVTFEPFLLQALEKTKGNKIFSSADAPGLITDILTFRSDFIDAHQETVAAIVDIYFKALKFWQENPDEANAINAKEHGVTKEEIAEQLKGISLLDLNNNNTAFTYSAGTQSLYGNMRRVGDFVLQHHPKPNYSLDTDQLIDKRFIKNLFKE